MTILMVATKSPWPPIDGGRLLLWNTLGALRDAGLEVVLVAPVATTVDNSDGPLTLGELEAALSSICEPHLIPVSGRSTFVSALRTIGRPITVARHTHEAVRIRVKKLLSSRVFAAIHAEQIQALPQVEGARSHGVPVVLRAQNVESDLWRLWAEQAWGVRRNLLRLESRRLAVWEGASVAGVAQTWALSQEDGCRLADISEGRGKIVVVPPPFPPMTPVRRSLEGEPAVVVMGSQGWRPNEDAVIWFAEQVWPTVLQREPRAILHLFGAPANHRPCTSGIRLHAPPEDSAEAFPLESIQVVPLRVGSGVRIKILEAWARGVPVVGTPQAFAGLEVTSGREGLVAQDAGGFAQAISHLHRNPAETRALVQRASERLLQRHAPAVVGRQMAEAYATLAATPARVRIPR